ncbi:hypothetical protein TcCL_Unassigned02664, partial [Trypanosoma cruzi]
HLAVRVPAARGTNFLETTAFRVCPPASPSMYVVNLCGLFLEIAHSAQFATTICRLGPAAPIAGYLNSHHELRDGRSRSTTAGENLAATSSGMECELSDDPAQPARISGRSVSFPDVTAQRVLRVSHWTSTPLHGVGPTSAVVYRSNGGRPPATGRHAAATETCRRCSA